MSEYSDMKLDLVTMEAKRIAGVLCMKYVTAQLYTHQRCSNRLENALEHMRRRSLQVKSGRSLWQKTPYDLYNTFYGPQDSQEDESFHNDRRNYYGKNIDRNHFRSPTQQQEEDANHERNRHSNKLAITRVDVEDLKVRMPQNVQARWVEIDKCKFSSENSTLDTRLIFPDLTLSGRIVLQPKGGKCNMILRLRHAGIDFRTTPIGFDTKQHLNEESRRMGAASVRTDSHFSEPGFISVFAHGCQGPTGVKLRQNSKRRFGFINEQTVPAAATQVATAPEVELSSPQVVLGGGSNSNRWGKFHNPYKSNYDIRSDQKLLWDNESGSREFIDINGDNFYHNNYRRRRRRRRDLRHLQNLKARQDELNLIGSSGDILNFSDNDFYDLIEPDARAFADIFAQNAGYGSSSLFSGTNNQDDISDALTTELEKLFSLGVRGLLTTYMQKTLQPAIKETLMENMGYRLSYG